MFFPYSLSTVFDGKLLLHVLSRVLQVKDNKHNTRNLTHTYYFFYPDIICSAKLKNLLYSRNRLSSRTNFPTLPLLEATVFDGKLLLHVLSRVLQVKDNKHNTRNLTHTYYFFYPDIICSAKLKNLLYSRNRLSSRTDFPTLPLLEAMFCNKTSRSCCSIS